MSKRHDTDPMGLPPVRTRTMLGVAPPAGASQTDDRAPTTEAASNRSPAEEAPPSSGKVPLTKAEIRSLFNDLSDSMGDPTKRAEAPESEIAQYAEPRPLPSRGKTPVLEPAIVVRKSVEADLLARGSLQEPTPGIEDVLPGLELGGTVPDLASPSEREEGARRGRTTVRARPIGARWGKRVAAMVAGGAVVGTIAYVVVAKSPGEKPAPIVVAPIVDTSLASPAVVPAPTVSVPPPSGEAVTASPPSPPREEPAKTPPVVRAPPATIARPRRAPLAEPSTRPAPSAAVPSNPLFTQERM